MFCAIDFGTSNSAITIPDAVGAMRLVELEPGQPTMPTAMFYFASPQAAGADASEPACAFGRAAIAAYVDGLDGRLMRSMKSILGSDLIDQTTDVGGGPGAKYLDVVAGYLKHLKHRAEAHAGVPIGRVVLGRPVYFVDDDAARDARAQAALECAARQAGFDEIHFQYEPIAAAFDHENEVTREQIVLVADIGGGTSDFAVVRVGPERAGRADRRDDILASHGVHVAGTDFDRRLELAAILPAYGYGAFGPARPGVTAREVPSGVYFDLATWHLINTVYNPARVAELRGMRSYYGNPLHHRRLMLAVDERLGHELAAHAEQAKITIAGGAPAHIDLSHTERGLEATLTERQAFQAIEADIERIAEAARVTVAQAGLQRTQVDALYFTGGSTSLRRLSQRITADFERAETVHGDRFASVAAGLGIYAQRWFERQTPRRSRTGLG